MSDALFSRDEVLAGLPARRARTLLYLVESRVGHLVTREHDVARDFPTDLNARQRDQEFLEAFLDGRDPPLRPTIQDLERHAERWASLVPNNPRVRAALAQQFGQKYRFAAPAVPRIRAAVGLDLEAVQRAYHQLHGRPIGTIYTPRSTFGERARWSLSGLAAWIDTIPPFWATFVLTLTFNTSQAFLALPVALAGIGPLAGAAVLLVLGIVNVLTIAAMAEAVGRSGAVRFGRAYLGRLVADYLGVAGSLILTGSIAIRYVLGVLANYVGLSTTLATSTGLPSTAWVPILFLAGLYFLWRGSFHTTLALMVLLGFVNLGLMGLIALVALPYADADQLLYHNVPILDAVSLGDRVVQPVLGVVLIAYFGHAYVNQIANGVLPRDPSARSLIWGSVAGIACTMVFYIGWVLATSASAGVEALAGASGTVLSPLAERIGLSVQLLGSVLALSLLGMSLIRNQNVLFQLVLERLPSRRSFSPLRDTGGGGVDLSAILSLPDERRELLAWIARRGVIGVEDLAIELGRAKRGIGRALRSLEQDGLVLRSGSADDPRYRVVWAPRRSRGLTDEINRRLGGNTRSPSTAPRAAARRLLSAVLSDRRGRFAIAVAPIFGTFLVTEWLLWIDRASYTRPLSVAGVIIVSLLAGMFPVLLLTASRRRGELVPMGFPRWLGHPTVVGAIYLFYMVALVSHGLVIWESWLERTSALLAGATIAVATVVMIRHGAFKPRLVVELRDAGAEEPLRLRVTSAGAPIAIEAHLETVRGDRIRQTTTDPLPPLASLRAVTADLPETGARQLKVWLHRPGRDGDSEPIPGQIRLDRRGEGNDLELHLVDGQAVVPLQGPSRLHILLERSPPATEATATSRARSVV